MKKWHEGDLNPKPLGPQASTLSTVLHLLDDLTESFCMLVMAGGGVGGWPMKAEAASGSLEGLLGMCT